MVAGLAAGPHPGLIAMRDEPQADAADAIRQLKAMGIAPVILTGDNPRTAAPIAAGPGMEFRAEMMPEDKLNVIRKMGASGGVMMIGDGINEAPALKQAGVGVAMGSGTDVALETADAAFLRDRVADVPALIRLARASMANIHQNVTIAPGLKPVFPVTSVLRITGLRIAILADTGATLAGDAERAAAAALRCQPRKLNPGADPGKRPRIRAPRAPRAMRTRAGTQPGQGPARGGAAKERPAKERLADRSALAEQ